MTDDPRDPFLPDEVLPDPWGKVLLVLMAMVSAFPLTTIVWAWLSR